MKRIRIALAGNPNAGKTSIFNRLTGTRQKVGNYPGVTVEKKEGVIHYGDLEIAIVDLPGTYSLTGYSQDEVVARQHLLDDHPDLVVDIVDASNLERHLYLTTQIRELGLPVVVVLNMMDVATAQGKIIDLPRLAAGLGVTVIPTVGHKGEGLDLLLQTLAAWQAHPPTQPSIQISYGTELEGEIARLLPQLANLPGKVNGFPARWLAVKLLERDQDLRGRLAGTAVAEQLTRGDAELQHRLGAAPEVRIAEARYGFITGVCQGVVTGTARPASDRSDRIDKVLLHPWFGVPIFLAMMFLVFQITFTVGAAPMAWLAAGIGWLSDTITTWWPTGPHSALCSLLVEGIIAGVGAVVAFLPQIMLLFMGIAILEDTGYMARAAFLMDRLMQKAGLHGKSFIPMLVGFGCNIPAMMATRTLENKRDRFATLMIMPFISCGARYPIYVLFIPAFFPGQFRQSLVMMTLYLTGILLAVGCAKLLRVSVLRGAAEPLVLELPPYRMPTVRSVLMHMWTRAFMYLQKAGTVILGVSIVLWACTHYPQRPEPAGAVAAAAAADPTSAYLAGAQALNPALGLAPASTALHDYLEAEVLRERAPGQRHAADAACAAAQEQLLAGPDGAALRAFQEQRDAITAARAAFDDTVEAQKLVPGQPAYEAAAKERDAALAALAAKAPAAYATALAFLDTVDAPYQEARTTQEHETQSADLAYTVAGHVGHWLEPVLKPLGFDWRIGTALVGTFAAKEVFIAQMGIVFAAGDSEGDRAGLSARLQGAYTPLQAFCIMLFLLIGLPCMATLATMRQETGSWAWAIGQSMGFTALAWILTLLVFQAGKMLSLGLHPLT